MRRTLACRGPPLCPNTRNIRLGESAVSWRQLVQTKKWSSTKSYSCTYPPPLSSERQEKEGIQVTAKNKMNIKNVCMSWWDKRMLRKRSIIHYLKLSLINSNILFKSNIQDIEVSIIFLQIKWLIL